MRLVAPSRFMRESSIGIVWSATSVAQKVRCLVALRVSLDARGRLRVPRILGPRMLWVTRTQFFSDLRIGAVPEAPQILSDLHWTAIWRQQCEHHGLAARSNARRFPEAEQFL